MSTNNNLQNEINNSKLTECQKAQMLNLFNTLKANNVPNAIKRVANNSTNPIGGPVCPCGVAGQQGPLSLQEQSGPSVQQDYPDNVPCIPPGDVPVMINYSNNVSCVPDTTVENVIHCNCSSAPVVSVVKNTPLINPNPTQTPTTNQKVFIKKTVLCDNKTANPLTSKYNVESYNKNSKNTTDINVKSKSVELYILYLESELERQRKLIKQAYLNPDIKK